MFLTTMIKAWWWWWRWWSWWQWWWSESFERAGRKNLISYRLSYGKIESV